MSDYNLAEKESQKLARFFYVFSDPTRLRIITSLLSAESDSRCVNNIAQNLHINQPTVSQQLRILKNAGLVKVTRDRQFYRYAISDEHVKEILKLGMDHLSELKGVMA